MSDASGRRFGWSGSEKPPCPSCGHQDDSEELRRVEERVARLTEEMLRDG